MAVNPQVSENRQTTLIQSDTKGPSKPYRTIYSYVKTDFLAVCSHKGKTS